MGKKKVAERPEYAMHLDVGDDDAEEEEEAEVGVGGKKSNGHFAQEAEVCGGFGLSLIHGGTVSTCAVVYCPLCQTCAQWCNPNQPRMCGW